MLDFFLGKSQTWTEISKNRSEKRKNYFLYYVYLVFFLLKADKNPKCSQKSSGVKADRCSSHVSFYD